MYDSPQHQSLPAISCALSDIQFPVILAFWFHLRSVCQFMTPNAVAAAEPIIIPASSPLIMPPFIIVFLHIWKGVGYGMIVYLATIAGLDTSMYEAAVIDGASKFQQAIYITLPGLKTMLVLMFIQAVGGIFNSDFGLFYQVPLGSGLLYNTTQTIDTYVYRALLEMNNVSMSSAASVFQAIIGFVLVMVSNTLVSVIDPENALF